MKISFSFYTLQGKKRFKERKGALLRFAFNNGCIGYADCHPWSERGDLPLMEQLALLQQDKWTPITRRAYEHAQLDGKARLEKKYLFQGKNIPPSHWLLDDSQVPEEFLHLKVKVGRDPLTELPVLCELLHHLPRTATMRLDFNGLLSKGDFAAYMEHIKEWKHRIDFIEDPYPYDAPSWEQMQSTYGIPLACDHRPEKNFAASSFISVVKPAVQRVEPFLKSSHKLVITSYLDHPLGQLVAAYTAAIAKEKFPEKILPCGLLSHYVYEKNAFSEQIGREGTVLVPPQEGTGFGFDTLLSQQKWELLVCL